MKHHNNPISKFSTLKHTTFHMTGLRYHIFEANLIGNKSRLDIPLYPMWVDSKPALYSSNLTYCILVFYPLHHQSTINMHLTWTLFDRKRWLNLIQKKKLFKSFMLKNCPKLQIQKKISFFEHVGISSKFVGVFNDELNSKPFSLIFHFDWWWVNKRCKVC